VCVALNGWKRACFDKFCQVFRDITGGFGHGEE
jgi:hypothetical protein